MRATGAVGQGASKVEQNFGGHVWRRPAQLVDRGDEAQAHDLPRYSELTWFDGRRS
jgi:hypothetical protein